MKRSTLACALFLVLVLGGAVAPRAASATPFDAGRVPADAEGIGHLDADALRKTTLYSLLATHIKKAAADVAKDPKVGPIAKALIDSAQGVSFWVGEGETGAAVIELSSSQAIAALLDKLPHRNVTIAGKSVRKMTDDDAMWALVGDLIIISSDERSMKRTLDVVTGKAKGMAKGKVPKVAGGVFFLAALGDKLLDKVKKAADSQTLKVDMTAMTISIGESNSALRAEVHATLTSAEAAQNIKGVVDGLVALGSLADEAKNFQPFLHAIKTTVTGKALEISFTMPARDLVKLVESMR